MAPGRFARRTAAAIRRCAARTLGRQGAQAARLSSVFGAPAPPVAVVFDGAGYHIAKDLTIREKITLIRLPPRAPELNPMENIWDYPRATSLRVPRRSLIPRCALHCSASASSPSVRAKQLPRSATLIFRSAEPAAKSHSAHCTAGAAPHMPWRFSVAGRISARITTSCRRPKTCTKGAWLRQRWNPTPVFGLSVSSRLSGILPESLRSASVLSLPPPAASSLRG